MEHEIGTIQVTTQIKDHKTSKITDITDVIEKYRFLGKRSKEHFYAVFLRSNNEVIGDKLIGLGNTQSAPADIKDIARTAILANAAAVILVHNHPSKNNEPSQEDIQRTNEIQKALQTFNIDLLDHVIITQKSYHSMAKTGNIKKPTETNSTQR